MLIIGVFWSKLIIVSPPGAPGAEAATPYNMYTILYVNITHDMSNIITHKQ